jgi:type IV pilus assembly protein PilB
MTIKEKILNYIQKNKPIGKDILKSIEEAKDFENFKRLLIENRVTTEEELLLVFSKEFRMPFLDLKKYRIPYKNKELLPSEIAFKYKVLPLCKIGSVITLATHNPLDIITHDDIKILTKAEKIDVVLSREEDILRALEVLYKTESLPILLDEDTSFEVGEIEKGESLEDLINESVRPPIVRAVDLVIYNALKKRASDIHIEPYENKLLVKYRIDGVLHEEFNFPKKNQSAVIARLKIISSLNITESRLPQDGRFKVKLEGREIDFRVSILPTHFGE